MCGSFGPDNPLRLAALISGGGSTLENLLGRIADGRLRNTRVDTVISSNRRVRGVELARRRGFDPAIIRPADFDDVFGFSHAIADSLDAARSHLVIMGGFLCFWRIPPRYQGRVLNIHPALLPAFGGRGMYGLNVHRAVLASGAAESGCTVHVADNEYDHGPIVAQRRVRVEPGDTPESLADRVGAAERELYPEVVQNVADHGLSWLP